MNDVMDSTSPRTAARRSVRLEARPEPIELTPARTAVIGVDLQNGYAARGEVESITSFMGCGSMNLRAVEQRGRAAHRHLRVEQGPAFLADHF